MSDRKENATLAPRTFIPLPLGSVQPHDWLLNQLRIQASGLSGHLDEFWPDIADSGWIGGKAEGWERGPYWLDGIVPLAYLLDDPGLKKKAKRWVDYILSHQHEDGWLGPIRDTGYGDSYKPYDPWPAFVISKAMMQYHQATGDVRIIPAMQKFYRRLDALLDERPLFDTGKTRWPELVLCVHWLFERTGEGWLVRLAAKAHEQGFDWAAHFTDFRYKDKVVRPSGGTDDTHVVHNAMAVKQSGVWFRQSRDPADRDAAFHAIESLDRYHGQVTGVFTGDENLAGKSPSQGTELCAVVEYMFSLETLLSIFGEPCLGDRLERIAFNALPATFKPDMWAHQYDQQVNQVICRVASDRVYVSNGPDANIFGLEPNYGCCTANMHQGWPKFTSHLWMRTPDDGLAAVALAPSSVTAEVAGKRVHVELRTEYPFGELLEFVVSAPEPVRFPLLIRIPAWAEEATLELQGETVSAAAGTFHRIEREWHGETTVVLRLPMRFRLQRRYHDSAAIERGPLVYSLKVGEEWRPLHFWMRTPDDGLAAVALTSNAVTTEVRGKPVHVILRTNFPFGTELGREADVLAFSVRVQEPVHFALLLPIPKWAKGAEVEVEGEAASAKMGSFHRIEREWHGETIVLLRLPVADVSLNRRYMDIVPINTESLAELLNIEGEFRPIAGDSLHGNWEVYPTTPWNYALQVDTEQPENSIQLQKRSLGDMPFSPEGAPLVARVKARRLPE